MKNTLFALLTAFIFFALTAPAKAAEHRSCQLVRELSDQLGCSSGAIPPPGPGAVALPAGSTPPPSGPLGEVTGSEHNYLVNSTFGPSQCKTQDLSKEVAKELRAECDGWVKERKADLGNKYITGTCTEACEECNMGLRRCSYKGTVHYAR